MPTPTMWARQRYTSSSPSSPSSSSSSSLTADCLSSMPSSLNPSIPHPRKLLLSSPFSLCSSSSSWLYCAIALILLTLSAQTLQILAVDPVVERGIGGESMGRRPNKGADFGNNRMDIKETLDKKVEGLKSVLKIPKEKDVQAMREHNREMQARNFKDQALRSNVKKESLVKQIQAHEEDNNLKQQDMRKREMMRHQRQQRLDEQQQQQQQQQQQKLENERVRLARAREREQQRETEHKWVADVQRKAAAEKLKQRQDLDNDNSKNNNINNNNQPDSNKLKNDNNNINDNFIKKSAADNQKAAVLPTVSLSERGNVGAAAQPVRAENSLHDVGRQGGIVLEQKKQVQGANKPAIQVIARNNNNNNNDDNRFVTQNNNNNNNNDDDNNNNNNEFPRLSNRRQNRNKVVVDDNNNDNADMNNNNDDDNADNGDDGVGKPVNNDNHQVFPVNNNNNENVNNNNFNNAANLNNNQNGNAFNVNGMNNNNINFVNNNNNVNPPRVDVPPMGGININWDWEDFSIMFDNYGGAEMKVRRSPHPSTGEPWPMPQYYSKKDNKVYKISKDLRFVPTGHTCDILDEAMARHLQRVLRGSVEDMYDNLQHAEGSNIEDPSLKYEREEYLKAPTVSRVEIRLRKACPRYPSLESDESYDLVVKKKKTFIYANEIWGVLRGLETLGQLVWRGTDGFLYIKETVISDYPRFPHRGLHVDTSRHYLFKEVLFDIMDSMEMNKLNVFHWHIVDDQSFPYESKVYPELSRKGAFHPSYVYTLEDIAELVEYARMRGIRVMPEFDTPGHTYSWGLSRPELLTQCFSGNTPVKGYLGPMDPSKNSTYRFLSTLFQEVMDLFKDQFLHLGGDEVPLGCWQSNPEVMAFANELNRKYQEGLAKQPSQTQQQQQQQNFNSYGGSWSMWSEEIKRMYEYYENRLIKLLTEIGRKRKNGVRYIMWQEVMNNNLQLPNDTIIQVWMGDMGDVMRATSLGYQVLYSTCWYLDHIEYGTKWPKYYHCDPVDQSYGYHIDEKKVLGGEVAFWSEYFSNENLIPMMWPRASAAAERLWSNKEVKNLDRAAERLSEHRCRMIKRGINAGEISGPGYCLHAPPKRRLFNDTIGCKGGNCSRLHNFVEIEDIQVHLSQRGGGLSECGNVFSRSDSSIMILLILIFILILFMVTLTRSSSRFGRMRHCKNRSILLVFVLLLFVYFLCYTTIGLRAFEFSGSIHKTFQEDKRGQGKDGGLAGLDGYQEQKRLMS